MNWVLLAVLVNKFLNIIACTPPSFDNLTVQSNFNLSKFLGIWFEIKWLPGEPHNESDIWRNYYQSFQFDSSSAQKLLVPGRARVSNSDTCFSFGPWSIITNNSAKMILEKQDITNANSLNWPYYILKTDYDHYALIYSCRSENYTTSNPCEQRVLWVFSRRISLPNPYSIEFDNYIENELCVNLTQLEITPHDGKQCYSSSTTPVISTILFIFLFFLYI